MPDALDKLRRHASLTDAHRAALDFQIIAGTATRAQVASLLTAILCEEIEGFHGEAGDYHEAAVHLMETMLQSAVSTQLITYRKLSLILRKTRATFCPSKLLLQWGDTRRWLEDKRRDRAMQSLTHRLAA